MPNTRNLTDADVAAIAEALKEAIIKDFKLDVGNMVTLWIKRVVLGALIVIAAHGVGADKALLEQVVTK